MTASSEGWPPATADVLGVLGWGSEYVVEAATLGAHRLVACALDTTEHQARLGRGQLPTADPFLLGCVAHCDPEFLTRPSPVRIDGAVAVRRRWDAARRNLAGFTAFGPRAAVLPGREARGSRVAVEAVVAGFGVVAVDGDGLRLVHPPDVRPPAHRDWVNRLVEEVIYDAVLAARGATAPGRGPGAPTGVPPWSS